MSCTVTYTHKLGDAGPLTVTLTDASGAVDVSAATVTLVLVGVTSGTRYEYAMADGGSTGVVTLDWSDVTEPPAGYYYAEIQADFGASGVLIFPSGSPDTYRMVASL